MKINYPLRTRKSNLLQIVSSFFIFAILSNIIYIPCYFYIRNINQKNVIEHHQQQLENGMQTLDASMDALFNLSNIISNTMDYTTTYYSRSDFSDSNLNKLRKTVNTALLPYDCITEAGLTMDDTILFTKKRIFYELDILSYRHYFSCDNENYLTEFSGTACTLPTAGFTLAGQSSYEAITIGYRWRKDLNMYFFAHYPLDKLFSLFAADELLNCSYLAVYSGDTLLAESGTFLTQDYVTLNVQNNLQLDVHVVLQIPDSYIEQNLAGMNHLVKVFFTIVLLAALLWVLAFSFALWQPFRHISNALYSTGHLKEDSSGKNFTDSLIRGISDLGRQLTDYKQILENQRELSRIHIFEKTLYRGLYSEKSIANFHHTFPDFPAKWQLAMVQYASDDNATTADMMQAFLTQYLQAQFSDLFILPQYQDTLLILLPVNPDGTSVNILTDLCSQIAEQHNFFVSFTVSGIYADASCLPDAFQDLEYKEFSSLPQPKAASVSMQQLQTMYYALQCGDAKAAVSTLKNSTAKILAKNDLFAAKHSYRMLGYVLVSLKMETNDLTDIPIPPFRGDDIHMLYEKDLPQCFYSIAEQIRQQHTEQTERLEQDILEYIQTNLANQQLSVALVSDHFHISAPTLQKRMNAICGKTFSSYVESSRMEKARQLLRETNDTVQDIAESVGYINSNSFFKAFKRNFGETPLSYRNRNT